MPIKDINDSLHYVNRGMNQVWRDSARHRYEPTFRAGPCTQATPYVPAYIKMLADAAATGELPWLSTKELPAPADALVPVYAAEQTQLVLVDEAYKHVLPRPLLDIIISVSRARVSENTWYQSPLRMSWAHERLKTGQQRLAEGNLTAAAKAFAEVFGTLLPGLTVPEAGRDEKNMAELSWRMLAQLVDGEVFMRWLMQALVGVMPDENTLTSLHHVSSRLSHEFRIGPGVLRLAEEIQEVERQLEQLRHRDMSQVKHLRLSRFDAVSYHQGSEGRIRFYGSVFSFTMAGGSRSTGFWLFDRNDSNKVKFMSFTAGALPRLLKLMEDAGFSTGSDSNDCEWYTRLPYSRLMRKRLAKGMNPLCVRGFCAGLKVDITESEKAAYDAEISRLFAAQADHDQGIDVDKLEKLEKEHAKLVKRFEEANKQA